MPQLAPLFAVRLATRLIVTCSAMVLILNMTEHALAFDCLAYKPERAQGQWHADVVSGKICWYGPNWRSFLPKAKARVESSQLSNSKPKKEVVNRKPDTQVVRTELESSRPDVQIESSKPDTQVVKIENSKPDVQVENSKPDTHVVKIDNSKPDVPIENSKPEIAAVPTSPLAEAVDLDKAQDSSGLRKPTSAEAAEFANAASLEFKPEPAVLDPTPPKMTSEPQSMTDLLVAFSIIALGTIVLVTLIMRSGSEQDVFYTDIEEQRLEYTPVDDELAPPLQPNADDEHVPLEELEHGFLTQSLD